MTTEPQYRLVADEHEPLTLDVVAAAPREPRRYEQDPLAANMSAATNAAQIILSDTRETVRDDSERMQDLVSDMFHLADLLALDMDDLVNSAQRNYEAEIRGVLVNEQVEHEDEVESSTSFYDEHGLSRDERRRHHGERDEHDDKEA